MAFIDNGSGMLPKMARYALSWGSGTHFDDPAFIGKFGFGLPNASINQTRLVEVYTKTAEAPTITKAVLDARRVKERGLQKIEEPSDATLPEFVQIYLDKQGLAFDHGTVVVWVEPDRLSYKSPALMKEHLLDDFGVTYRYLLDKVDLFIDKTKVAAVDPLFSFAARPLLSRQGQGRRGDERRLQNRGQVCPRYPPLVPMFVTRVGQPPGRRAFVLMSGEAHDVHGFGPLFRMIGDRVKALLADRGYDADAIRAEIAFHGIQAVIPAKRGRRNPAAHDRPKYRLRSRIEQLFSKLKNWRRIATRNDKTKTP